MAYVAGQKLRVSDLDGGTGTGGSGSGTSRMSSDVTVNNTTSFTDTGLSVAVVAGTVYAFRAWLRYQSGNTPDMKIQPSSPSGTTGNWSLLGHGRDASPAVDTSAGVVFGTDDIGTSKTVAGDSTGTLPLAAVAEGTFSVTADGTFKLRIGQRTATASNTILRAGSYMTVTRIA